MNDYKRLDFHDRKIIEEGLDKGLSYTGIARAIGRSPSTVSHEVRKNRMPLKHPGKASRCPNHGHCTATGLCAECPHPGGICSACTRTACEDVCRTWLIRTGCAKTASAPWVCNGCAKKGHGCNRRGRAAYCAAVADQASRERRSASRSGVNMTQERFEFVLAIVRDALARDLSPYEIATLYADKVGVSASTLYRWVEAGYGGMANIDLERKVGFRPRREPAAGAPKCRGDKRTYEAFCALPQDDQDGCCEMDTVMGRKTDARCLLTLYLRPAHLQLYILLEEKTGAQAAEALDRLESLGRHLFGDLFGVILTDNGPEFEDPARLERSVTPGLPARCRVFYCDPRQSQQKGRCEKNHSELRQLLPKGRTTMDNLTIADIAHINTAVNSTPRKSLCGLSPIEMLCRAYGERAAELLDMFSIGNLGPDDIDLRPIDTDGGPDGGGCTF